MVPCQDGSSTHPRDRHTDPVLNVRPDATLKAQAMQALSERSRELQGFVAACLNALVADPGGFLEQLNEPHPGVAGWT
ncbi:UNVERIFIED_CONTAM: hypothetical protein RKD50_009487 [Streptomyces canus]